MLDKISKARSIPAAHSYPGDLNSVPCYVHPDMFRQRAITLPNGDILPIEKVATTEDIQSHNGTAVFTNQPSVVHSDMFYIR